MGLHPPPQTFSQIPGCLIYYHNISIIINYQLSREIPPPLTLVNFNNENHHCLEVQSYLVYDLIPIMEISSSPLQNLHLFLIENQL
jgi:hypothetical protein